MIRYEDVLHKIPPPHNKEKKIKDLSIFTDYLYIYICYLIIDDAVNKLTDILAIEMGSKYKYQDWLEGIAAQKQHRE